MVLVVVYRCRTLCVCVYTQTEQVCPWSTKQARGVCASCLSFELAVCLSFSEQERKKCCRVPRKSAPLIAPLPLRPPVSHIRSTMPVQTIATRAINLPVQTKAVIQAVGAGFTKQRADKITGSLGGARSVQAPLLPPKLDLLGHDRVNTPPRKSLQK